MDNTSHEVPSEYLDSETLDTCSEGGNQLVENDEVVEEGETSEVSDAEEASTCVKKTGFKSSRKRLLKRKRSDNKKRRIAEAFRYQRQLVASAASRRAEQPKDECGLFGDYIANKLRKFDDRSRAVAEHKISEILFDLEMNGGHVIATETRTNVYDS